MLHWRIVEISSSSFFFFVTWKMCTNCSLENDTDHSGWHLHGLCSSWDTLLSSFICIRLPTRPHHFGGVWRPKMWDRTWIPGKNMSRGTGLLCILFFEAYHGNAQLLGTYQVNTLWDEMKVHRQTWQECQKYHISWPNKSSINKNLYRSPDAVLRLRR